MIDFGKIGQQLESRQARLLGEAEYRRLAPTIPPRKVWIPPRLALTVGDWLIGIGTRLKAPYQPVNLPMSQSETGRS